MGKHSIKNNKNTENNQNDSLYARMIARQGEGLVEAENKIKKLEKQLVQERINRIEDLKDIRALATCNNYNNEKAFLHRIGEMTTDKITELTSVNAKIKELSSHTGQSI